MEESSDFNRGTLAPPSGQKYYCLTDVSVHFDTQGCKFIEVTQAIGEILEFINLFRQGKTKSELNTKEEQLDYFTWRKVLQLIVVQSQMTQRPDSADVWAKMMEDVIAQIQCLQSGQVSNRCKSTHNRINLTCHIIIIPQH